VTRVWSVSWDSVASDGTDWHNALEAVQLAGPKAKRIADLSLHQYDMGFCERLLTEHASKFGGDNDDLSRALWIAVLTKFVSCFREAGSARWPLHEKKVYASNSTALRDFEWILDLRNKHIAHDENSYYGAAAFAWLEQNGDARQVASMTYVTQIDPTVAAMMQNLVGLAQDYIRIAIADAGKALLAEVQAMTPEERTALPKSIYVPLPTGGLHSDIGKKR
jgi:hypothetical protein